MFLKCARFSHLPLVLVIVCIVSALKSYAIKWLRSFRVMGLGFIHNVRVDYVIDTGIKFSTQPLCDSKFRV